MLEFLKPHSDADAIEMLKDDHGRVKDLFEEFEYAENRREKMEIAMEALQELKIHAELEEKIFYPAVRRDVDPEVMNEADEEHHVANLLIAELEEMDIDDDHFEAKFFVLAENMRHHIREEEDNMLPEARRMDIDFELLGQRMQRRKWQLLEQGIPPTPEEELIAMNRGAPPAYGFFR